MGQYIFRRIVASIPVLVGVLLVTFALARLIPGGPCVAMLGEKARPEVCATFNHEKGFDRPIPVQLAFYTRDVLTGAVTEAGELDVTLGSVLEPAATGGDPQLVERLVTNLVENALRHNTPGGRADVTTGIGQGHAVLRVTNTGPVVAAEALERLFEPFQRLDPGRAGGRHGLGLGLSIVQTIATTHGATVTARPRDGGGLDVRVIFPLPDQ